MKRVSIQGLKSQLSAVVAEAESGRAPHYPAQRPGGATESGAVGN